MTFAEFRRVPNFTLFLAVIFGLQMVDRSVGPILPLFLREIGTDEARVPFLSGLVFTTAAASAALGNQTSGWWLRRLPIGRLVPLTAGLAAVAALVFGAAPSTTALMLAALLFGLSIGIATTSVYTAASLAVPPSSRGLAFGYLTTAYLTALALSPVVAGLIGAVSMRAVFLADALALGFVAWCVWRLMTSRAAEDAHADALH
jgi:DHA1 family multidrug resistance protein-like MFS transporter